MPGCGVLALDEWLAAPVLKSDQVADQAREQRLHALLSGAVSA